PVCLCPVHVLRFSPDLPTSSSPSPSLPHTSALSLHDALPISSEGAIVRRDSCHGTCHPCGDMAVRALISAICDFSIRGPSSTRQDRKSTRLNSSHVSISYAVFCLIKERKQILQAQIACQHITP